jgi:hypothetical protein
MGYILEKSTVGDLFGKLSESYTLYAPKRFAGSGKTTYTSKTETRIITMNDSGKT